VMSDEVIFDTSLINVLGGTYNIIKVEIKGIIYFYIIIAVVPVIVFFFCRFQFERCECYFLCFWCFRFHCWF
jgi:hypothetical protein